MRLGLGIGREEQTRLSLRKLTERDFRHEILTAVDIAN